MKVLTYFDLPRDYPQFTQVLDLWEHTWRKNGFTPIILTEADARRHPRFAEVEAHVATLPTVNTRHFERACYLRWLAIIAVGGGLATDSDVLNRNFRPEDVGEPGELTCFDAYGGPGVMWIPPDDTMVNRIMAYRPSDAEVIRGKPHCSDMYLVQKVPFPRVRVSVDYGRDGWETAKLVHFPTGYLKSAGFPKAYFRRAIEHLAPDLL